MLVEDSLVVRELLRHIVSRDARLRIVAAAGSGEEALGLIGVVRPDVISMDIRLPGIDGLETTRRIMAERPTPIVVVADAVEDASLRISMNALRAGALSVVEKPVATTNAGYEAVADEICTQLRIMAQVPVIRRRPIGAEWASRKGAAPAAAGPLPGTAPTVLGLAASTGGPPALARVLGALPADFPLPVLVVQHMGAAFMDGFAAWLDSVVPLPVSMTAGCSRFLLTGPTSVINRGPKGSPPGSRRLAAICGWSSASTLHSESAPPRPKPRTTAMATAGSSSS
ncbi:response regulator, partial [uncultured Methylobacterium sp.]|uniref:response regulator n=1 Tax=uncultured Methylobacterium sp. TaxID=157278 RepID=UPI0025942230